MDRRGENRRGRELPSPGVASGKGTPVAALPSCAGRGFRVPPRVGEVPPRARPSQAGEGLA